MRYVTYDADGNLTACLLQDPPADQANIIEIDEALAPAWVAYIANAARDGIELAPVAPPVPAAPTVAEYTAAIQAVLDTTAKERNYDGILSACTYATSTIDKFRTEGQACVEWRDKVWAFGYDLLAKVDAGQAPAPAIADLVSILPQMEWPA